MFPVACGSAVVTLLTHTMLLDARTDLSMSSGATDLVAEIEGEPLMHVRHERVQ